MNYPVNARGNRNRRRSAWGLFVLLLTAALAITAAIIALNYGRKAVTAGLFEDGIVSEPADTNAQESKAQDKYRNVTMTGNDLSSGDLVLVNNKTPYSFEVKQDLVSIYDKKTTSYFVRDKNVLLSGRIMDPLNQMMDDFTAQTGLKTLNVVAGWRSYDEQENIYADCFAENGAEYTARYVANPGCSEHHTGLAIDLSVFHSDDGTSEQFCGEDDYTWILENAWKYGFVQRYESGKEAITMISNEPWHFRYVGVPHAFVMKQQNLCLEEYIEYLKNYPFDGEHLYTECLGKQYEIYTCEGYEISVPVEGNWMVSGNNTDGFIITICNS